MKTAVLLLAAMLVGCTASDRAEEALAGAGYRDVRLTGYAWFACGKDDTFATAFEATGPTGKRVSGAVCAGLLKGSTIRID